MQQNRDDNDCGYYVLIFLANILAQCNMKQSTAQNLENIESYLSDESLPIRRVIPTKIIPLLKQWNEEIIKQITIENFDSAGSDVDVINANFRVLFSYDTHNKSDDQQLKELQEEHNDIIYSTEPKGMYIYPFILFHRRNDSKSIIQPDVNHHTINHQSIKFRRMYDSFLDGSFNESSQYHFSLHCVSKSNRKDNFATVERQMISFDENNTSRENEFYITQPLPFQICVDYLIPFFQDIGTRVQPLKLSEMAIIDWKLYQLAISSKESPEEAVKVLFTHPSSVNVYECYFQSNVLKQQDTTPCDYQQFKGRRRENISINEQIPVDEYVSIFNEFQHHIQSQINFCVATVEGIHRLYCLSQNKILKSSISAYESKTNIYTNKKHPCIVSILKDEYNNEWTTTSHLLVENECLVDGLYHLRQISKSYMFHKNSNMKTSEIDVLSLLIHPDYCYYNMIMDSPNTKKHFQNFLFSNLLTSIIEFQKSMKEDCLEGCDSNNGIIIPNINNQVIRDVYFLNKNNDMNSFWKRMDYTITKTYTTPYIYRLHKLSFECFGRWCDSKRKSLFREVFSFRQNQTRFARKEEEHFTIYALSCAIVCLSIDTSTYKSYQNKITFIKNRNHDYFKNGSSNRDDTKYLRNFDSKFIGEYMLSSLVSCTYISVSYHQEHRSISIV